MVLLCARGETKPGHPSPRRALQARPLPEVDFRTRRRQEQVAATTADFVKRARCQPRNEISIDVAPLQERTTSKLFNWKLPGGTALYEGTLSPYLLLVILHVSLAIATVSFDIIHQYIQCGSRSPKSCHKSTVS